MYFISLKSKLIFFAGVDTWIRLQARMLAAILEFSHTAEACRKKFEKLSSLTKMTSLPIQSLGTIEMNVSFMTPWINGGINQDLL